MSKNIPASNFMPKVKQEGLMSFRLGLVVPHTAEYILHVVKCRTN